MKKIVRMATTNQRTALSAAVLALVCHVCMQRRAHSGDGLVLGSRCDSLVASGAKLLTRTGAHDG